MLRPWASHWALVIFASTRKAITPAWQAGSIRLQQGPHKTEPDTRNKSLAVHAAPQGSRGQRGGVVHTTGEHLPMVKHKRHLQCINTNNSAHCCGERLLQLISRQEATHYVSCWPQCDMPQKVLPELEVRSEKKTRRNSGPDVECHGSMNDRQGGSARLKHQGAQGQGAVLMRHRAAEASGRNGKCCNLHGHSASAGAA